MHEADQPLPNVKKSKRASRNNGTRTSARPSGKTRNRAAWCWMRPKSCGRCVNTPQNRPHCSASGEDDEPSALELATPHGNKADR